MKNFLSVTLLLTAVFLVGCGQEEEVVKEDVVAENFEVTGNYKLYKRSPQDYWQDDKKGRVCFEFFDGANENRTKFAEAIGNTEEFCFSNEGDVKNLLKTPFEGLRGSGTFIVKDITKREVLMLKDDPCIKTKTCLYNEAVLVEVKELETALDWKERQAKIKEERVKAEAAISEGEDDLESDVAE